MRILLLLIFLTLTACGTLKSSIKSYNSGIGAYRSSIGDYNSEIGNWNQNRKKESFGTNCQ